MNRPPLLAKATNDFVVKFANVNGSGSASANAMFAKAVFRMGIPVSPRNIFPSNIQGAPTWYEVRISDAGYLGSRGGHVEIMISTNPQSIAQDIQEVCTGGYFLYDNSYPLDFNVIRRDIHYIGLPLTHLASRNYTDPRQRQLFTNIIYVGALAYLLGMDFGIFKGIVQDTFHKKEKLIAPNIKALTLGFEEAKTRFDALPLQLEQRDKNAGKILIEGNTACGLGAVYGGATVMAWYPITPSTSVADAYERYATQFRVDEKTGKYNFAFVQAEDEIAAIGMVVGANWNGARAFTATSGPGVSLMQEFLGLAYFSEVPTVLIDVQRTGPSTGMPTRTQQSDLLISAYASHGDTKNIVLIPSDAKECFDMTADAFDIADRLQTPVILLLDLDIGMNESICDELEWDDNRQYDRGKVYSHDEIEKMAKFSRYLDVDGDAITYRTYPGVHPSKGSYFNRGTSRNEHGVYTENSADYEYNMQRLSRKWQTAKQHVPEPLITLRKPNASIGILHFGTSVPATHEAIDQLCSIGYAINDLIIKAIPFQDEIDAFIQQHETLFIVEQNRDAQMKTLLVNELQCDPARFISILHFDGKPITAKGVFNDIKQQLDTIN